MNKPQYLAELDRLLIFMTGADRSKTLDRIGALFDKAGPGGADALVKKLGSPTSEAIRLSRIYSPFEGYEDKLLDSLERDAGLEAAPAPGPKAPPAAEPTEPEAETEPEPGSDGPEPTEAPPAYTVPDLDLDDLPGFEPPPIPSNFVEDDPKPEPKPEPEPEPEPEAEPEPDAESAEEEAARPLKRDDIPDWMSGKGPAVPPDRPETPSDTAADADAADAAGDEPAAEAPQPGPAAIRPLPEPVRPPAEQADSTPAPPDYTVERVMPLGAGIPLFILSLLVIAVPLALVCLILVPILALPGVALLLGAWLAAVGGLWCISYIADAVMLFGVALVALAAALVALWLGLWLLVAIVSLYIRGIRALTHLTLGKKVKVHA